MDRQLRASLILRSLPRRQPISHNLVNHRRLLSSISALNRSSPTCTSISTPSSSSLASTQRPRPQCLSNQPISPIVLQRRNVWVPKVMTGLAGIMTRRKERKEAKRKQAKADEWWPKDPYQYWDMTEEIKKYPLVNAKMLAKRRVRPRRCKMLVRDFIDDALYNPFYGYFSKRAVIFETEPIDFNAVRDEWKFDDLIADKYDELENKLDLEEEDGPNHLRAVWHTPTELFKPHYGNALARYLVTNYKLNLYPYNDFIIYEIGAGNGTLMRNVLDYIRVYEPDVYARTKYRVIEISGHMASLQMKNMQESSMGGKGEFNHTDKIEIFNKSVFEWDTYVPEACYFLCCEVLDNMPHDMVRYDPITDQALQGYVLCDKDGDYHDFYLPELDPLCERYLRVRDKVVEAPFDHPLLTPPSWRKLKQKFPGRGNLTDPEYLPTTQMMFFDILREWFPNHRLLATDFDWLPDTVRGYNAPVVQTRYERETVAVTTPFVYPGYYDYLFPTNFPVMDDMYRALTGKLTRVMKHHEFLEKWAYLEDTQTRYGDNPMTTMYGNVSFLSSV